VIPGAAAGSRRHEHGKEGTDVITLGTTTLPLAGWIANPQQAAESRAHRLQTIRQIVEGYDMQVVELTLDLQAIYPQVFDDGFYNSVAELQQELGFVCTVHLPFLWVEPASLNETIRHASVDCLRQAVEVTRAVDVRTYVLHLWGIATGQVVSQLREPVQRQALLGVLLSQASRSLSALCDIVEPEDLCVENLEDSLFDLALPIIEQHRVSICLDAGHLALQGGDALTFLARHGERVCEIHLHDAIPPQHGDRQRARDHLALGQGQLDYAALIGKLAELDYQGPIILEVNSKADLEQSLAVLTPGLRRL
jgi:sugar phosphate isomerase/epimerase